MLFTDLSDDDFVKVAESHVEALNHAHPRRARGEDPRPHLLGHYEGPHVCDIPMARMFDTLMRVKATYVPLRDLEPPATARMGGLPRPCPRHPRHKVLVPGVVDTTTNFVEHPDLIRQRLERFTEIVGKDRVIAGSDCGFGTFAGFGAVDPEIAWPSLPRSLKARASRDDPPVLLPG